jgi:uridine kinase
MLGGNKMPLSIEETNRRAVRDPAGFIAEGDAHLRAQIALAADAVINNMARSRIVLLSGPSGSGKTTCAEMLEAELSSKGVRAHSIALDNYYDALPPEKTPLTPEGKPDLESPLFLDAQLLDRHFSCIERGESITVPTFDFAQSRRGDAPCKTLRVGEGEVAIFEGIHALNDLVSAKHEALFAFTSARRAHLSTTPHCALSAEPSATGFSAARTQSTRCQSGTTSGAARGCT